MREEAVPELSYRGWSGVPGGGVALAGQPPHQGNGSHVWSVGVEQPLAADGRSLCSGQWTEKVGAPDTEKLSTAT